MAQIDDELSASSNAESAGACTSSRYKVRTGLYNGIAVFVKFIECDSLTLSRDDLLELKLVRRPP